MWCGIAAAAVVATISVVPEADATCPRPGVRWSVVSPPFATPSAARSTTRGDVRNLRAVGVDPADARVLVATDGAFVQRSDDGGCTWHEVWRLPSSPGGPSDVASDI